MFFPESQIKIWLYAKPTDMRRSFTGLAAMAKNLIGEDPLSGNFFVFINRRQTQLKILYFDRSGFCIWAKRLEQGRFNYNKKAGEKQVLNWTQLKMIIEGIELKDTRQTKRYCHPTDEIIGYNPRYGINGGQPHATHRERSGSASPERTTARDRRTER
jgi:transposase